MVEQSQTEDEMRSAWVNYAFGLGESPKHANAEFDRFLARVRRDAAEEVGRYIEHLHPERTAREAVRVDIEIAADRMGHGLYANGRERESP